MPKRTNLKSKRRDLSAQVRGRNVDSTASSGEEKSKGVWSIALAALVLGGVCFIVLKLFSALAPQDEPIVELSAREPEVNLQNLSATELESLLELTVMQEVIKANIDIDAWTHQVDRDVSALVSEYPQDAQVIHLSGLVDLRLKRTKLAEPKLRRAVELTPQDLRMRFDLAEMLVQLGRDHEAVDILSVSNMAGALDANYLGLLGDCQQRIGQLEEAEKTLVRACEMDFDDRLQHASYWQKLAKTQMQLQKLEAAEQSVRRACELNAGEAENWLVLSTTLRLQRRIDEARGAHQRWQELNEHISNLSQADRDFTSEHSESMSQVFSSIYRSLAIVYQTRGLYDKSQKCFEQSLTVDPNDSQAMAGLAAIHRRSGNLVKAVEANRRLLQFQPEEFAHYNNMANLAMELGRPDAAEGVIRLACLRMPDEGIGFLTLARLLLLLKKHDEALQVALLAHQRLNNAETAELVERARQSGN